MINNYMYGNPEDYQKEMVTIPLDLYDQLHAKALWLECLEIAGVDNWVGIEFATHFYYESMKDATKQNRK